MTKRGDHDVLPQETRALLNEFGKLYATVSAPQLVRVLQGPPQQAVRYLVVSQQFLEKLVKF